MIDDKKSIFHSRKRCRLLLGQKGAMNEKWPSEAMRIWMSTCIAALSLKSGAVGEMRQYMHAETPHLASA
jgi:hypothetical protein